MIRTINLRVVFLAAATVLLFLAMVWNARAQHNHDRGHDQYRDWASQKTGNCCSDRDCGALKDDEWKETPTGTQIKISGTWCPVNQEHRIIRGKSPDWTQAHACIAPFTFSQEPCQRLLCFTGTPKF